MLTLHGLRVAECKWQMRVVEKADVPTSRGQKLRQSSCAFRPPTGRVRRELPCAVHSTVRSLQLCISLHIRCPRAGARPHAPWECPVRMGQTRISGPVDRSQSVFTVQKTGKFIAGSRSPSTGATPGPLSEAPPHPKHTLCLRRGSCLDGTAVRVRG